jgi:Tfp pilus assembly protein PilE
MRSSDSSSKLTINAQGRQDGLTLIGLIFLLAIAACVGLVALKIVPTYAEYRAISNAIKSAKASGTTVREIQQAFDRSATTAYIDSISGKDLVISKETGDLEISFAYEKKIPLVGPASLVIDYAGTTAPNGVVAKPVE